MGEGQETGPGLLVSAAFVLDSGVVEYVRDTYQMIMTSRCLAVALAALLAPTAASAHPHVFIDIRVEVRFDDAGNIEAFEQTWLFDEMFSVFIADDMDGDGDGLPDEGELDRYMVDIMRELRDYDYYTEVEKDGADTALELTGEMTAKYDGANLEISFEVSPATPLAATGGVVRYRVYDPTYYIDILHAEADDAIVLAGAPAGCAHKVIEPNPDPAAVDLAASLDQTMSAGDTLGAFFAEQVVIDCGPSS